MFLTTSSDLILLVGSICLLLVTGFTCWLLYEAARLLHQTNQLVEETREKISAVELLVKTVGEKIMNLSQYAGIFAEGGKKLLGYFEHKNDDDEKPMKRKKGKEPTLDEIEEGE
ncbi:hypothetical protein K8R04_02555 [Candidatus Uhrbacteria bacterium]|nr:hypothetical protein [Candidatus Uhrbacteria bacterium]